MDEDVKQSYNYTFNLQQTEKWEKAESKWFHLYKILENMELKEWKTNWQLPEARGK